MLKYNFHVGFEWVSSNGGQLCDIISINQVNQHQYSSTPTWMGAHSPLWYHFKIITFKRSRKHSTMYGWVYWTQYVYAWPSPSKATRPISKNTRAWQSHLSQRQAINILRSYHRIIRPKTFLNKHTQSYDENGFVAWPTVYS